MRRTLAALALIGAALVRVAPSGGAVMGPLVARLTVSGIITQDRTHDTRVAKLADDDRVKALLVGDRQPGLAASPAARRCMT